MKFRVGDRLRPKSTGNFRAIAHLTFTVTRSDNGTFYGHWSDESEGDIWDYTYRHDMDDFELDEVSRISRTLELYGD